MSRVERQADQSYENKISYLRTVANDLRQAQTFGSSNVRIYRLFNASSNIDITLPAVTTSTVRCAEVTLTPNTAASNPLIAYNFIPSFTSPSGGSINYRLNPLVPINGVQKFRIYILSADVTKDISIAFNFWTISPGTYSAQEVTP